MREASQKLDGLAVALSVVCLIHCLLLPVSVTLLPILGLSLIGHGAFHDLMLIVVLPTSIAAFGIGCRRHGQGSVLWVGGLGLALLVIAALAVDTVWGAEAERYITMAGGVVLAIAHLMNFRYCRTADCPDHGHNSH